MGQWETKLHLQRLTLSNGWYEFWGQTNNFNQRMEQKQALVQIWFGHVTSNWNSLSPCWNETWDTDLKVGKIPISSVKQSRFMLNTHGFPSLKTPKVEVFSLSLHKEDFFLSWRELTCDLVSALKPEGLLSNTELVDEDTQIRHIIYLLCNHHFFTD